jgi:dihydroorotate dehydrogenase electron transfer subunit
MSHSLEAAFYADRAGYWTVDVLENVPLAKDTWRVRFAAPDMARRIVPGQFLMMRLPGCDDPLLGRPLALYDTAVSPSGEPIGLDVVYLMLGKMTSRLARFGPGQQLEVWGPLGNGFQHEPADHLIMVGGGIGQTPFMALAKESLGLRRYGDPPRELPPARRVTLCYGARRAEYLAGVEEFERLGVKVHISTDDGSAGHHGFVTDLLKRVLDEPDPVVARTDAVVVRSPDRATPPDRRSPESADSHGSTSSRRIVACGPVPMMKAVAAIASTAGVRCQVSLETPMACGIGICFSCVAKVRDANGDWDYRRTCVEGPIFPAERIVWE